MGYSISHYKFLNLYDEPDCDPMALNHGVLAIGYGSENGKDYFLVNIRKFGNSGTKIHEGRSERFTIQSAESPK